MPLTRADRLFESAIRKNYAVAAFNISSIDSLEAVLSAAEAENSPVIVQVLHFTEKYVKNLDTYLKAVRLYIENCKVPVLLQHDHCSSVEEAKRAVDNGFGAVMFDGSALPYEQNCEDTKTMVKYAHAAGCWVEAELGSIPSLEDDKFEGNVVYTSPELADAFIRETGCDSLAVSVGTAHGGVASDTYLPFDFKRLEEIVALRPSYPFVLHGAASLPHSLLAYANLYGAEIEPTHICSEEDVSKACRMGIRKANMDVDNWLAYTGAIRQFFTENPEQYFPTAYLKYARDAWENEARHKIRKVVQSSQMAEDF